MSSEVEQIRRELEQAIRELKEVEGKYGSDQSHPVVGQYYANVQRLERELRDAGG